MECRFGVGNYLPDQRSGKVPTIVMAHGSSAVKEMYLDKLAEVFAEAGLGARTPYPNPIRVSFRKRLHKRNCIAAALVFDNRNFGASRAEPRQKIDPWEHTLPSTSWRKPTKLRWTRLSFHSAASG
jgi:uncharacterized protein